jgi:DNA-binding XRE family transcriptional regulator
LTDTDDRPNVSPMFDHATARAARIQAGLTPTKLASSIGVSERTVTRWEAGQGEPDYSTGLQMEALLGLTPGALYRLPEEVR